MPVECPDSCGVVRQGKQGQHKACETCFKADDKPVEPYEVTTEYHGVRHTYTITGERGDMLIHEGGELHRRNPNIQK